MLPCSSVHHPHIAAGAIPRFEIHFLPRHSSSLSPSIQLIELHIFPSKGSLHGSGSWNSEVSRMKGKGEPSWNQCAYKMPA